MPRKQADIKRKAMTSRRKKENRKVDRKRRLQTKADKSGEQADKWTSANCSTDTEI
jgi:hypothetical protein